MMVLVFLLLLVGIDVDSGLVSRIVVVVVVVVVVARPAEGHPPAWTWFWLGQPPGGIDVVDVVRAVSFLVGSIGGITEGKRGRPAL